jgi:hypothetical protein
MAREHKVGEQKTSLCAGLLKTTGQTNLSLPFDALMAGERRFVSLLLLFPRRIATVVDLLLTIIMVAAMSPVGRR